MMLHIVHRLPITTVSVVLLCVYSLVSIVLQRIKRHFARKIVQHSILPRELLNEILNEVLADSSTSVIDLTSLSLVCREWNEKISKHEIWFHYMNTKWINFKHKARDIQLNKIFRSTAAVLSPKLSYAVLRYRMPLYNYYASGSVLLGDMEFLEFPADLIPLRSNKNLWVPWLNHNITKRPETLWKFLYSIIRHPKWIYPLLAYRTPDATHKHDLDPLAVTQIDKLLLYIAILFNFMPWLDHVLIVKLSRGFEQFMNGNSAWYDYFQLWKYPEMSTVACLQTLTAATSLQAFESSFFNASLMTIRVVMVAISVTTGDMMALLIFFVLVILSIVVHAQTDTFAKRLYWARVWLSVGLFPVIWCAIM